MTYFSKEEKKFSFDYSFFARLIGLILYWLCGLNDAKADSPDYIFLTENNPPFNMLHEGKIVGIATAVVKDIATQTGIHYSMKLYPWARAYALTIQNKNTCIFSTARTPDREEKFKWIGPIAHDDWVFYGLSKRKIKINTIDDVKIYKIGVYMMDARQVYLDKLKIATEAAPDDELNIKMLLAGRIDLWATGEATGHAKLAKALHGEDIVPIYKFNHVDLYLACNVKSPENSIRALSDSLNKSHKVVE